MRALVLAGLVLTLFTSCLGTGHWPETVRAEDGSAQRYEVAGDGEPTIVFVHGWSCHRAFWNEQIRRFKRVRRVLAVDLAGHGESEAGARTEWTMQAFGADVVRACDAAKLDRVVLVGHSMGGAVVLEATKLMGDRVVGIVGVDTLHDVARPMRSEHSAEFFASLRADYPKAVDALVRQYLFSKDANPKLVDLVAESMSSRPPEVAIPALDAYFDYDAGAALAAVKVPVHCINTLEPTNLAANQARNPRFTAVTMPGVGHFPMLEDPERFARLMSDFVRPLGDG